MKLSDLPTHAEVLAEHLVADPEFRKDWERTALARAIANALIAYRARSGLSQTALARRLGMEQAAVARLESGEHNPSFPTLLRIARSLGIEIAIDIAPPGHDPQLIASRGGREEQFGEEQCGLSVVVAPARPPGTRASRQDKGAARPLASARTR